MNPQTMNEIALSLSATITAPEYKHEGYTLALPDGLTIIAREDKGRLNFSPAFNGLGKYFSAHRDEWPKMTTNAERPAGRIADEIKRRLLAPARELIATLSERKAKDEAYKQVTAETAQTIARALGETIQTGDEGRCSAISHLCDPYYYRVEIYGAEVNLNIDHLTAGQAETIIKLLQERKI